MIIGGRFDSDPIWVQHLQHDLYWSIVGLPFDLARKIYLKAEKIIGIETQLGQDCKAKESIDHRVLQYFHDTIAAKFRYESRNNFEVHLPGILNDISEEDEIRQRWLSYFRNQVGCIFDDYPSLPKQIIIAVTYPNPDERGKDAEDYIMRTCNNINSFI